MELMAAIIALKKIKKKSQITIYTDSKICQRWNYRMDKKMEIKQWALLEAGKK